MTTLELIDKYVNEINNEWEKYINGMRNADVYRVIKKGVKVLGSDVGVKDTDFYWNDWSIQEDKEIFEDKLLRYKSEVKKHDVMEFTSSIETKPIIFISHQSNDKKYGDAIRNFIVGLGVKDDQLIYTSHPLHKIPLNERIYDYLRKNIDCNVFMIILWSNTYLESPACLNEMGALWVTQNDYTSMYVPDFAFGNPKYHECAVDTTKMGAVLNPDAHCRAAMLEFKNKITELFDLDVTEQKVTHLIETFIEEIS